MYPWYVGLVQLVWPSRDDPIDEPINISTPTSVEVRRVRGANGIMFDILINIVDKTTEIYDKIPFAVDVWSFCPDESRPASCSIDFP